MKLFRQLLPPAALLVLLALSAHGQATLELSDGSPVTGRATRYDGDTQTLYFRTDDGRELVLGMDELDGRSVYLVHRSVVPKDDGVKQLQLANFARDVHLFAHSNRHYRYALRADPSLEAEIEIQTAMMRGRAAAYCMRHAQDAIEAGDRRDAEQWLTTLVQRLPGEPLAEKAARMLNEQYQEVHGGRDDALVKADPELLVTYLKRGKQLYDSMLEHNLRGLQARSGGQARSLFDDAIVNGERALAEVERVARERTDATSQEVLEGYRRLVIQQLIETRLNLASYYMIQTNLNRARTEVNAALALDPRNAAALAMRSRIEVASTRGFGWW